MKIDSRMREILKNFSTINPSILFKPGDTLRTTSPLKTILAHAKTTEQVEGSFAIADLNRFLSTLSLFEHPTVSVERTRLQITDGKQKVNYTFGDPDVIVVPTSDKKPTMPSIDVAFDLSNETLQQVRRAMGILSTPELAVVGDGSTITLQAVDSKKPGSDVFAVEVGTTEHTFNMYFRADNIKLLPENYRVELSSRRIAHFEAADVEYWVAVEAHSTFTE